MRLFTIGLACLYLLSCGASASESKNESNKELSVLPASQSLPPDSSPKVESVQATPTKSSQKVHTVEKEYLIGKFDYRQDERFVKIASTYTNKPDIYMRKEAYESFQKMHAAALKDGIKLVILSATRNFKEQKAIWDGKWTGKYAHEPEGKPRAEAILKFSSMPTTSRHHWGTDVDLNDLNNAFFQKGEGKKIYDWMIANAAEYGFCNVYSSKDQGRTGYEEEKWHWSYLPLASDFLTQYKSDISYEDINGFLGEASAKEIDVITNYVGGINPACK